MSEVDPDPNEPAEGQGRSTLGGRDEPGAGDPTDGGKRGQIGEAPSIAADEPDDGGPALPGRRWAGARGADAATGRRPRTGRLIAVTGSSPSRGPAPAAPGDAVDAVAAVLNAAADERATVVLAGHVQPDADALGSTLALAEGLRRRGARVLATFPGPFTLPASLGWLPGAEGLVPSSAVPRSPDVFVSLDAASPGRLGELAAAAGRRRAPRWSSTTTRATPASATSALIDGPRRPPSSSSPTCSTGSA